MLVTETEARIFENQNDVDRLIARSQQMGSDYYTLIYYPHGGDANGRFRYIRVTLRKILACTWSPKPVTTRPIRRPKSATADDDQLR